MTYPRDNEWHGNYAAQYTPTNPPAALPSSPVSELVDARKLWKQHGGDQHGPHTERLTMPLDNFSGFVNALVSAATQSLSTRNAELEREVKRLREVVEAVVAVSAAGHDTVSFLVELRRVSLICAAALSTSPQVADHA